MSISNSIGELRTREQIAFQKEEAAYRHRVRVLDLLPPDIQNLTTIHGFGYCADATLVFQGDASFIQELLPRFEPLECVSVIGSSHAQKPVKYVRENELTSEIYKIHGVLVKDYINEKTVYWWTAYKGIDLAIQVKVNSEFSHKCLIAAGAFYLEQSHYPSGTTTYFSRSVTDPLVQATALTDWFEKGEKLGAKLKLSKGQLYVWKKYLTSSAENTVGVPERFSDYARSPSTGYVEEFADNAICDKLDSFWASHKELLAKALYDTEVDFERVRVWLSNFFENRGCLVSPNVWKTSQMIMTLARAELNLDVRFKLMRGTKESVQVEPYFSLVESFPKWIFKSKIALPGIRPQDLNVQYQ